MRGALRGGAPSDISMGEHLLLLRRLSLAGSRKSLRALMLKYLDSLLDHIRPAPTTDMDRAVAQVRKSLRETLGVSQSLSQYARMLGVSEGHLSRRFAAITGQTYRAERRRIRLEAARQMLCQRRLKISAIAGQLGIACRTPAIRRGRRQLESMSALAGF
jgi:AraC-like DNA-binding protein